MIAAGVIKEIKNNCLAYISSLVLAHLILKIPV